MSGRIITFYSYKGGAGRSMALANVAWLLAEQGKRVLVIDWDLEAPGVYHYFRPFLNQEELNYSGGVIDFLLDFVTGAITPENAPEATDEESWYVPYTNILRYAVSLDWQDFLKPGTVDFVPAGRQDAGYSIKVSSFDWHRFYEKLGGGLFLEAVKKRLRQDYDFVLIDSRTGVSDTSGICTVQMPDDLVVCFIFNNQSIEGASAIAKSAFDQRIKIDHEPGLRVWPLPCRVELAEKQKLELARRRARSAFAPVLRHIPSDQITGYWGRLEIPYQPYYAYEEILAVFGDEQQQSNSMLSSMERLASVLVGYEVRAAGQSLTKRQDVLSRYAGLQAGLSCSVTTRPLMVRSEGVTENVGDIVLEFSVGPDPGQPRPEHVNVQLFLNTNITNRVVGSDNATDCELVFANGRASGQRWQGRLIGPNSLVFLDVPVNGPTDEEQRYRLIGLRANAGQLGFSVVADTKIQAFIGVTSNAPIVMNNPDVTVGILAKPVALVVETPSGSTPPLIISQEEGINQQLILEPSVWSGRENLILTFVNEMANSFRNRQTERGNTGTQFLLRVSNVPEGVELFCTLGDVQRANYLDKVSPTAGRAKLVSVDDRASGGEVTAPIALTREGFPLVHVPVRNGSAYALWEWVAQSSESTHVSGSVISFGIAVAAVAGKARTGTAAITGCLAPLSTVLTASQTAPIPRFILYSNPSDAFIVVPS